MQCMDVKAVLSSVWLATLQFRKLSTKYEVLLFQWVLPFQSPSNPMSLWISFCILILFVQRWCFILTFQYCKLFFTAWQSVILNFWSFSGVSKHLTGCRLVADLLPICQCFLHQNIMSSNPQNFSTTKVLCYHTWEIFGGVKYWWIDMSLTFGR